MFTLHQRRPGEEEKNLRKVRCSSAQARDQLNEAQQLPWKESTNGENRQNWFTCVWPEGGTT
jgi:hypothetical protein